MSYIVYYIGGPWDLTKKLEEGICPRMDWERVTIMKKIDSATPRNINYDSTIACDTVTYKLDKIGVDYQLGYPIYMARFESIL